MLLELGTFASLLLSVICLVALFHTAFLLPAIGLHERILLSIEMLALSAGVSWVSGWLFCHWERKVGVEHPSVAGALPVLMFWWVSGLILVLFVLSWYLETYYPSLRSGLPAWGP